MREKEGGRVGEGEGECERKGEWVREKEGGRVGEGGGGWESG